MTYVTSSIPKLEFPLASLILIPTQYAIQMKRRAESFCRMSNWRCAMPRSTRLQLQQVLTMLRRQFLRGLELSSYSGFRPRRGSGSQRMRNEAVKPPYADYARSTAKWAALGDGYRYRNALCWLNFVGRAYQRSVNCLWNQWTRRETLQTWNF